MSTKRRRLERAPQYEGATYRDLVGRMAANVAIVRKRRGWTQEEAAHRCAMSTRLLQAVEAGASNVTMTTLARLCDGLEVEVRKLLGPLGGSR